MKFHHWALPRIPSSRDCIRKADMCGPTFCWICRWFLGTQSFLHSTVRLGFNDSQGSLHMLSDKQLQ
ncbi:hypothetical protein CFI14_06780 [Lactiplantibacillus pentosus]|uniref:Uncharacterized protein n=1 Tax=Lactiplantibacillus pentosus TaxID=1589 RepID=A0AB37RI19_LACPE|nr:hypothetical protein CFK27_09625 [Lactiplantibacillus pentosus]AYG40817.1 hypothetical protein CFI14_06780 [Lactiplantibacillus pentosus]MCT3286602.1 hypothetical protein [Lactiplantibacillus pentosus]RMW43406.1 hypothetical protein D6U20_11085 [Lactiplantibacillus pentosus]RMW46054.1 hypothetical protein D6U19_10325 [Lactiplantibacillus pentosus]